MSLLGTLQIANNSLFASQVGLQVTGNNIANANTPGYIRQSLVLTPAPIQLIGGLPLGLGVKVDGIIQKLDRFLNDRLRGALSDVAGSEAQEKTYLQLEALVGELTDTDLSTSLSSFFNSINDILNQPEDLSVRNLAVLQGQTLADDIGRLDDRVQTLRGNLNDEIAGVADDINRLVEEIAELNVNIVQTESGTTSVSDAVGLRDQREIALTELAKLVGIRAAEQPDGSVSVFVGGDFLVFNSEVRKVVASVSADDSRATTFVKLAATDTVLSAGSGKLAGLYTARDEVAGGFQSKLDEFAATLAFEFNKIYASGQGLTGLTEATSEFAVEDSQAALDQGGLRFTPVNGSFQIQVYNKLTGLKKTTDVAVRLNGLDDDTTLTELAATLDAVEGLRAAVTSDRRLSISVDAPNLEFGFAHDTSGVLAALGVNTFFSGTGSRTLGVSDVVRSDPSKFAASQGGVGEDTENALRLASFGDLPLDAQGGESLVRAYQHLVADLTQASSVTQSVTEGFRVYQRTLEGQHLGQTGVSIDDEAVRMIGYQRTYQASAKLIATISELLDTLMNL